jgi:hypothetical protein
VWIRTWRNVSMCTSRLAVERHRSITFCWHAYHGLRHQARSIICLASVCMQLSLSWCCLHVLALQTQLLFNPQRTAPSSANDTAGYLITTAVWTGSNTVSILGSLLDTGMACMQCSDASNHWSCVVALGCVAAWLRTLCEPLP